MNGIPIREFDLLRSFHFACGRGNRKHYLYHVVIQNGEHLEAVPYRTLAGGKDDGGRWWIKYDMQDAEVIHGDSHRNSDGSLALWNERKRKPGHDAKRRANYIAAKSKAMGEGT